MERLAFWEIQYMRSKFLYLCVVKMVNDEINISYLPDIF